MQSWTGCSFIFKRHKWQWCPSSDLMAIKQLSNWATPKGTIMCLIWVKDDDDFKTYYIIKQLTHNTFADRFIQIWSNINHAHADICSTSINSAHFSETEWLRSHLYLRCCLQMGCQWMIWIHLPRRRCELRAECRCCWAEGCPEAGDKAEALRRLPVAEAAPAEGAACDSWRDALWKMWHTGLPAVADSKRKFFLFVFFLFSNTLVQKSFHKLWKLIFLFVFVGIAVCSLQLILHGHTQNHRISFWMQTVCDSWCLLFD